MIHSFFCVSFARPSPDRYPSNSELHAIEEIYRREWGVVHIRNKHAVAQLGLQDQHFWAVVGSLLMVIVAGESG